METPIGAYLDDYALLDRPGAATELQGVVQAYPWFTLGRYMELRALRRSDPAAYCRAFRRTDVRLFAHPYPNILLNDPVPDGVCTEYSAPLPPITVGDPCDTRPDTVSVIDDFLDFEEASGGTRIVPPVPDTAYEPEDISAESVEDNGEIATEMLAEIYLAQGLPERAAEIYYRLSLKYPEKSTYFASLIAEVQAHTEVGTNYTR